MENLGEGLKSIGNMDVGLKVTLGIATAVTGAAVITLPTTKQQERAALELFDRPLARLTPHERKTAEFQAGYTRWKNFWETKFYPMTRQLPGAQTPILNPYRGIEPLGGNDDDE